MWWKFTLSLLGFLVLGTMIHAEIVPLKAFTNVTVTAGKTAYLNCELENLENQTIVWMRDEDTKLISSGLEVFTSCERYESISDIYSGALTLKINNAKETDSGVYQCHIATNSSFRAYVYLHVYHPLTRLLGSSEETYVGLGKSINLSCIVETDQTLTNFIIWFHNDKKINYDHRRVEWNEVQETRYLTISTLKIAKALRSDGGNYTCVDTNNVTQNIVLHIFDASLNGGNLLPRDFNSYAWLVVFLV